MNRTFSEDELVQMCQDLDDLEARLRQIESSLTRLRFKFRESVSERRKDKCGYVHEYQKTWTR